MKKRLKQMIKKHINIVKSMYPELYFAVIMIGDDILVDINSLEISNEEKYEDLMNDFLDEYENKGYYYVYWGVNDNITCDNLSLLEDSVEAPVTEIVKEKKAANF